MGPAVLVVLVAISLWLHSGSSHPKLSAAFERPPVGNEEAPHPLGAPAPIPTGNGRYEVLEHQEGDATTPVAWDPCRPIHYVINDAGAPRDGLALIQSAVARVHTATGLQFVYDGPTNEPPSKDRLAYQPDRYGKRWAPALIAWSDENADPELAGYIAGIGAPQAEYTADTRLVYVTGQVILDRAQLSLVQMPDRRLVRAIMLHELGHLVGLDHTADRGEIMFSESQFNVRDYGNGDLRGLAFIGTRACVPNI